jgi:hypothetical protein
MADIDAALGFIEVAQAALDQATAALETTDPPPIDPPPIDPNAIRVPSGLDNLRVAIETHAEPGAQFVLEGRDRDGIHLCFLPSVTQKLGGRIRNRSITGTAEQPISITCEPGTRVSGAMIFDQGDHHLTLHDMDWTGEGTRTMYHIQMFGSRSIRIEDCHFGEFTHWKQWSDTVAIWMTAGASDIAVRRCVFEDIGADCLHTYGSTDVLVEDCTATWTGEKKLIEGELVPIGENFIDLKNADRWTVRNCSVIGPARMEGYAYSEGDPGLPLGSTSGAGEGIVIHKWGARDCLFENVNISGVTYGYKILGNSSLNEIAASDPDIWTDRITIRGGSISAGNQPNGSLPPFAAIDVRTGPVFAGFRPAAYPTIEVIGTEILGPWTWGVRAQGSGSHYPVVSLTNVDNTIPVARVDGGVVRWT